MQLRALPKLSPHGVNKALQIARVTCCNGQGGLAGQGYLNVVAQRDQGQEKQDYPNTGAR